MPPVSSPTASIPLNGTPTSTPAPSSPSQTSVVPVKEVGRRSGTPPQMSHAAFSAKHEEVDVFMKASRSASKAPAAQPNEKDVRAKLQSALAEVADLKQKLEDKENQVTNLDEECTRIARNGRREEEGLKRQLQEKDEEISRLRGEHPEPTRTAATAKNTEEEGLLEELSAYREQMGRLTEQLRTAETAAKSQLEDKDATIRRIEEKLSNLRIDHGELEKGFDELKKDRNAAAHENEKLRRANASKSGKQEGGKPRSDKSMENEIDFLRINYQVLYDQPDLQLKRLTDLIKKFIGVKSIKEFCESNEEAGNELKSLKDEINKMWQVFSVWNDWEKQVSWNMAEKVHGMLSLLTGSLSGEKSKDEEIEGAFNAMLGLCGKRIQRKPLDSDHENKELDGVQKFLSEILPNYASDRFKYLIQIPALMTLENAWEIALEVAKEEAKLDGVDKVKSFKKKIQKARTELVGTLQQAARDNNNPGQIREGLDRFKEQVLKLEKKDDGN